MVTSDSNAEAALPQGQQIIKQLAAVGRITLAITAQLDRDTLLKEIVKEAVEFFDAEGAGIYEYHAKQEELILVADHFRSANVVGVRLKLGEGMAGRLVAEGKPFMIVDDYAAWSGRAVVYQEHSPFGAVIEVLLTWQNEIIGVLYVDRSTDRPFANENVELLRLFADQAAIVLSAADLVAKNANLLTRLELLSKASNAIISQLAGGSLDAVLDLIVTQAASILNAESCGILLVRRPGYLTLEASYGHRPGGFDKGRELPIISGPGSGLTGHIASEGRLCNLCGDALTNHHTRKGEPPHVSSGECRSLLAIPLFERRSSGLQLVGLLRVDNKLGLSHGTPSCFTREDEWVATLFADMAIAAIASAGLVELLDQQSRKLKQLIADAPFCVVAIDKHGLITEFNDQAAQMLGYQAGEVLNQSVARLYADSEEPRRVKEWLLNSTAERPLRFQTLLRSKGGEEIPIRLAAGWLTDSHGDRVGSVGFFEDLRPITEIQQRLELLLAAANLVARAEKLVDGLAHLAELIVDRMGSSVCTIYLLYDNDAYLLNRAWAVADHARDKVGRPPHNYRLEVSTHAEIDRLLQADRPEFAGQPESESSLTMFEWAEALGIEGELSTLALIPLRTGARAVGLFCLASVPGNERRRKSHGHSEPATALANQIAVFIERIHLLERTTRRNDLLQALEVAARYISAEQHPEKLLHGVIHQAVELVRFTAGGLYVNQPQLGRLELRGVYALPDGAAGEYISHSDGLLGQSAQDGETRVFHEYALPGSRQVYPTVVALPLKQDGVVEAVLFLVDSSEQRPLMADDKDILNRFAVHATLALHTSRLLNREQYMFKILHVLHRFSIYFQSIADRETIAHVLLTATTAGFSLGFNRAALFLQGESGGVLVGRMGIGHLNHADANESWRRDEERGLIDLQRYLDALETGSLPRTPLDSRIRGLRVPPDNSLFQQAILELRGFIGQEAQLAQLPAPVVNAFEPAAPFIIAPLVVRERPVGLILADNKFTQAPITPEYLEALSTIAGSGALALDNLSQKEEIAATSDRLRSALAATGKLLVAKPPREVLQRIAEQVRDTTGAAWSSIILHDEADWLIELVTTNPRIERNYDIHETVRPNGISARVRRKGEAVVIMDTATWLADINPFMLQENIRAALCLPFTISRQTIGVLWLHFNDPRPFPETEIDTLQLYVNQAALAYEGARQNQELRDMQQIAQALATAENLPAVLQQIVHHPLKLLGADAAAFWPYDAQRGEFLPDNSVSAGFPGDTWAELLQREPQPGDTAYHVLDLGWRGVDDIEDKERYSFLTDMTRDRLRLVGVRSYQAVALAVNEEKLGVLFVNYRRRRVFNEAAEATTRTFAYHAALALKKAQLLDHVSLARDTARAVADMTTLNNLESTLNLIVEATRKVLNCGAVVLYVHDPQRRRFHYPPTMSGVKFPARVQSEKRVPPDSIVVQMMALDKPRIVDRVSADPDFRDRRFVQDEGIATCAAIPLRVRQQRYGVMFVNYRTEHRLTGGEQVNMNLFANQAAVAIQSAQVYEQARRRAEVQAILTETSQHIIRSQALPEILDRVVRQAWQLTNIGGSPALYVSLLLLDGNLMRLASAYPVDHLPPLQAKIGERDLDDPKERGVTGRAILDIEQTYLYVPYVSREPDYIRYDPLVQSELVVPLVMGGQCIGALNVEHAEDDAFGHNVIQALVSLAAQAAIAIQNVRAHDEAKILQQVTADIASTLEWERVLTLLLDTGTRLTNTDSSSILLWSEPEQRFAAAYKSSSPGSPPTRYDAHTREDGLAWRIRSNGEHIVIPDGRQDTRVSRLALRKGRRAMIGVPLKGETGAVGVLFVDSSKPRQFSEHQVEMLRTLGSLGGAAIEKVRRHEELVDAQRTVGDLTAELWQSVSSSIWLHAVTGSALTISSDVGLLRERFAEIGMADDMQEVLDRLDRQLRQLSEQPGMPTLSDTEGVESIRLNRFLRERVDKLRTPYEHQDVSFLCKLHLSDSAAVRANPIYLREAINFLITNSCEAMEKSEVKRLTITTRQAKGGAEIIIQDTGCGVPVEYRPLLFNQQIPGAKNGRGKGLRLVGVIVRKYGGEARLAASDSSGTTMVLWLPLSHGKR